MSFFNVGTSLDLTYRAGDWMAINEKRMALASKVTGNESPQEIAAIAKEDKALTLQGEQAKIEEEVGWAMWQAQQEAKQKGLQRHERMKALGVVFG